MGCWFIEQQYYCMYVITESFHNFISMYVDSDSTVEYPDQFFNNTYATFSIFEIVGRNFLEIYKKDILYPKCTYVFMYLYISMCI